MPTSSLMAVMAPRKKLSTRAGGSTRFRRVPPTWSCNATTTTKDNINTATQQHRPKHKVRDKQDSTGWSEQTRHTVSLTKRNVRTAAERKRPDHKKKRPESDCGCMCERPISVHPLYATWSLYQFGLYENVTSVCGQPVSRRYILTADSCFFQIGNISITIIVIIMGDCISIPTCPLWFFQEGLRNNDWFLVE